MSDDEMNDDFDEIAMDSGLPFDIFEMRHVYALQALCRCMSFQDGCSMRYSKVFYGAWEPCSDRIEKAIKKRESENKKIAKQRKKLKQRSNMFGVRVNLPHKKHLCLPTYPAVPDTVFYATYRNVPPHLQDLFSCIGYRGFTKRRAYIGFPSMREYFPHFGNVKVGECVTEEGNKAVFRRSPFNRIGFESRELQHPQLWPNFGTTIEFLMQTITRDSVRCPNSIRIACERVAESIVDDSVYSKGKMPYHSSFNLGIPRARAYFHDLLGVVSTDECTIKIIVGYYDDSTPGFFTRYVIPPRVVSRGSIRKRTFDIFSMKKRSSTTTLAGVKDIIVRVHGSFGDCFSVVEAARKRKRNRIRYLVQRKSPTSRILRVTPSFLRPDSLPDLMQMLSIGELAILIPEMKDKAYSEKLINKVQVLTLSAHLLSLGYAPCLTTCVAEYVGHSQFAPRYVFGGRTGVVAELHRSAGFSQFDEWRGCRTKAFWKEKRYLKARCASTELCYTYRNEVIRWVAIEARRVLRNTEFLTPSHLKLVRASEFDGGVAGHVFVHAFTEQEHLQTDGPGPIPGSLGPEIPVNHDHLFTWD